MDEYSKNEVLEALSLLNPKSRKRVTVDQRSYLIGILAYRFMMSEFKIAELTGYKRATVNYGKKLATQFCRDKVYMQNVYVYAQMFPFDFNVISASKSHRTKKIELNIDDKTYNKLKTIGSILGHDDVRTTIKFFIQKSMKLWEE